MENNMYLSELSRILHKHGIENGTIENGRLIILLDDQPVGCIEAGGTRCLALEDLKTAEASEAFYKAAPFAKYSEIHSVGKTKITI